VARPGIWNLRSLGLGFKIPVSVLIKTLRRRVYYYSQMTDKEIETHRQWDSDRHPSPMFRSWWLCCNTIFRANPMFPGNSLSTRQKTGDVTLSSSHSQEAPQLCSNLFGHSPGPWTILVIIMTDMHSFQKVTVTSAHFGLETYWQAGRHQSPLCMAYLSLKISMALLCISTPSSSVTHCTGPNVCVPQSDGFRRWQVIRSWCD
jgi:hypothetical protein